jgi:hypothetical protein
MNKKNKVMLNMRERKLEKLYGAVDEQELWKIRTNYELHELYKVPDLAADIRKRSEGL